jgi:hypothetical protein
MSPPILHRNILLRSMHKCFYVKTNSVIFRSLQVSHIQTLRHIPQLVSICTVLSISSLKNAVFWVSSGFIINRRFGGTCRLQLQGSRGFYSLPSRWRRQVAPKRRFIINPRDSSFQKAAFFIVTAVKISNPTYTSLVMVLETELEIDAKEFSLGHKTLYSVEN